MGVGLSVGGAMASGHQYVGVWPGTHEVGVWRRGEGWDGGGVWGRHFAGLQGGGGREDARRGHGFQGVSIKLGCLVARPS